MTDFFLEQQDANLRDNFYEETDEYFNRCVNYAQFLKQPLNLGMFVPCDMEGNILEQPKTEYDPISLWNSGEVDEKYNDLISEYEQAKERVLFEGFEIVYVDPEEFENIEKVVVNDNCYVGIKYCDENEIRLNDVSQKSTIEDLITHDITLTKSAQKQLGL